MWLLTPVAYGAEAVGKCFGTTFKLNRFNVRVLTMHRWFNISAAERDLQYKVSAACVMCWRELCSCVVLMCVMCSHASQLLRLRLITRQLLMLFAAYCRISRGLERHDIVVQGAELSHALAHA